jgi:hypothetical protein
MALAVDWKRLLSRSEKMLRKIDCLMIHVENVDVSAAYYP